MSLFVSGCLFPFFFWFFLGKVPVADCNDDGATVGIVVSWTEGIATLKHVQFATWVSR